MTQTITNPPLTSTCGNFYIGQTKDEAIKKGLDISLFNKIDALDGETNGTLSEIDIIQQREDKTAEYDTKAGMMNACAIGGGLSGNIFGWIGAGISLILAGWSKYEANEINEGTEKYLQQ